MIDKDGYRQNVGIILCNHLGQVLWAKRCGQHAWQFPQGGISHNENAEQAMVRELFEEVGLRPQQVGILGCTHQWSYYRLPKRVIRQHNQPICIGQKQKWFVLRLKGDDSCINLQTSSRPEFNAWRWVNYWYPIRYAAPFMRHVYQQMLQEFAPVVMPPTQDTLSVSHCSTEHLAYTDDHE